jgi:hypothetical protein
MTENRKRLWNDKKCSFVFSLPACLRTHDVTNLLPFSVSFTPQPLTVGEIISRKNWTGGFVGPRPGFDAVGKRKILPSWVRCERLTVGFILCKIFDRMRNLPRSKLPSKQDNRGRQYYLNVSCFPHGCVQTKVNSLIRDLLCCRISIHQGQRSWALAPKSQARAVEGKLFEQREPQAWWGKCEDSKQEVGLLQGDGQGQHRKTVKTICSWLVRWNVARSSSITLCSTTPILLHNGALLFAVICYQVWWMFSIACLMFLWTFLACTWTKKSLIFEVNLDFMTRNWRYSHSEEFNDDHLLLLDQEREFQGPYSNAEEPDNVQLKVLTPLEFEAIFRVVEIVKRKIVNAVTYLDGSIQIHRGHALRIRSYLSSCRNSETKNRECCNLPRSKHTNSQRSLSWNLKLFWVVEVVKRKIVNAVTYLDRSIQIHRGHSLGIWSYISSCRNRECSILPR